MRLGSSVDAQQHLRVLEELQPGLPVCPDCVPFVQQQQRAKRKCYAIQFPVQRDASARQHAIERLSGKHGNTNVPRWTGRK
jgi:hypothetical protein